MIFQYFIEDTGGAEVPYEEWDGTEEGRHNPIFWKLYGVETESFDDTLPRDAYSVCVMARDLKDTIDWMHENHAIRRKVDRIPKRI